MTLKNRRMYILYRCCVCPFVGLHQFKPSWLTHCSWSNSQRWFI